ncbi:MAG: excinuclease ABC subunit C [Verrucomicrobiaceae bacterium]|nr:excinuclease ABC subunit C [Verrucomicrobiaceae bacterium]
MHNTATKSFDHKSFLANLTSRPGVYQMIDNAGEVLYVGKARQLKSRVSSYFRASGLTTKTLAMVNKIHDIRVTVTRGETEALLLEQNLIKSLKPPYNIQLRDDKSYPYILLSDNSEFPRLSFYRGSRRRKGRFFGPYPSANATRETLQLLQKVFRVRQCNDSYFKNRSRPCLQYQIDRCTGPCVKLISPEQYARDVEYSVMFLQGKSSALAKRLTTSMEQASEAREFERAAIVRDQISDLRRIQEQQYVSNQGGDADVLAAAVSGSNLVVHIIYVRNGRIIGSKAFFPRFRLASKPEELLSAFIAQIYLGDDKAANIPPEIIVSERLPDSSELETALSFVAGKKIRLTERVRGHRSKWLDLAQTNAEETLQSRLSSKQSMLDRFTSLQENLSLEFTPERIECFDISHTGGEGTVGSCVVFDQNGPLKNDYRRFNVSGITPGDDYAAMEQVINRRFTRLSRGEGKIPSVLLIDGGKGQLAQAKEILEKFQLSEIVLVGIAKGISRRAGQETLFLSVEAGYREIVMKGESPGLHLLQQIRDEAHRFAITGHRQRRSKARRLSNLENIPGLGPVRRRKLLTYFGGKQAIIKASKEEIEKVDGISKKLAEIIYAELHNID